VPPSAETALAFDLDGVLVDTTELVVRGWSAVAASLGRTIDIGTIRERYFGRRTEDILREELGLDADAAAAYVRERRDDKTAEVASGPPLVAIPGAVAFVRAAVAGRIPVALVSSASASNVELGLRSIGLADAFGIRIDAGSVERGKPWPDAYLRAARALDRPADRLVVFEDSVAGVAAARAAGARCVALTSTTTAERLAAADLVIDDFAAWTPRRLLARLDRSG